MRWLIKCLQGVLWCSFFFPWLLTLCMHILLWHYLWRCCFFLSSHDLKGLAVVLCRHRAPLMLTLQPVMNSILLYLFCTFWLLPDVGNSAMTQNITCAAHALRNKRNLWGFFFVLSSQFMQKNHFKGVYFARLSATQLESCRRYGLHFLWENRNACSTTLTERQPLKRGRQISRHLLIHPNLRFIIVPQPCRKRSVTLGDCPATHLSNFTPLSSHPFYGRVFASSRLRGNSCLFGRGSLCS